MKHTIATKFIAFLLTVLALGSALAGMAGIRLLEDAGLYVNTLDNQQDRQYDTIAKEIAAMYANLHAVDTLGRERGKIPYELRQELYNEPQERFNAEFWCVELYLDGQLLAAEGTQNNSKYDAAFVKTYMLEPKYPVYNKEPEPNPEDEEQNQPEKPEEPVEEPEDFLYSAEESVGDVLSGVTTYKVDYYQAPEYSVTVYLREKVLESSRLHLLTMIYPMRYHCIALVVLGLVVFAAGLVFLLWISGVTPDGKVKPAGLNLIPLDAYALIAGVGIWLLLLLFERVGQWVETTGPHPGNLTVLFVNLLGILVMPIGFLMAFSAQIKAEKFFWWNHSVTGVVMRGLWKALCGLGRTLKECVALMPVIWQWVALYSTMVCLLVLGFWAGLHSGWGIVFLAITILISIAMVLYGGYALGTLLKGVRKMSDGELSHKIPTDHLYGNFRECAEEMNALSETTMQAVQNQVRAERIKTELITNVSHDIKTPLTSIINFVDLLGKPHSPEADQQYLEILSRQSNQLKKLIEDLMELSKASSGNLQPNIMVMDVAESVNQALGEFSDKLEKVQLTPVFHQPAEPVLVAADGRLTWRVLSNLLSNAVKYATPGTRVYVEIVREADMVQLSIKNVSKEELRLSAEDLLERFVRGDASRNREGSGLGLNIAKTLMEVQGGSLQLTLDGDLFKVTLTFPAAE